MTRTPTCQTWHARAIVDDRYQHTWNPDDAIDGRDQHTLNPDDAIDGRYQHTLNPDDAIDGRYQHTLNPDDAIDGRYQHTLNPAGDRSRRLPVAVQDDAMNGLLLARVARDSGPAPSWSRDAVPSTVRPFAPLPLGRDARFVLHGDGASALYDLADECSHDSSPQPITTTQHRPTHTMRRTR